MCAIWGNEETCGNARPAYAGQCSVCHDPHTTGLEAQAQADLNTAYLTWRMPQSWTLRYSYEPS